MLLAWCSNALVIHFQIGRIFGGGNVKNILMALAISVIAFPTRASAIDGNTLQKGLKASAAEYAGRPLQSINDYFFAGYARGLVEGIALAGKGLHFCPADSVDLRQLETTTQNFIQQHPDQSKSAGYDVVMNALERAFPCKR